MFQSVVAPPKSSEDSTSGASAITLWKTAASSWRESRYKAIMGLTLARNDSISDTRSRIAGASVNSWGSTWRSW